MARLPDIDPDNLTAPEQRVWDAIASGPRGKVEGPLRIWLKCPDFAERAQALGAYCRFGSTLPPRLSELPILVTAAYWNAGFEWCVHAPIARKAGLSEAAIEAVREGRAPHFEFEDEAAVYVFSSELTAKRHVSPETFQQALRTLGGRAVIDLVGVLGYYALISMTIVAFEVPLPNSEKDPFGTE